MGKLALNQGKRALLIETDQGVFIISSDQNDEDFYAIPRKRQITREEAYKSFGQIENREIPVKQVKIAGSWSEIIGFVELSVLRYGQIGIVNGRDKYAFDYLTKTRDEVFHGKRIKELFITLGWERVKQ